MSFNGFLDPDDVAFSGFGGLCDLEAVHAINIGSNTAAISNHPRPPSPTTIWSPSTSLSQSARFFGSGGCGQSGTTFPIASSYPPAFGGAGNGAGGGGGGSILEQLSSRSAFLNGFSTLGSHSSTTATSTDSMWTSPFGSSCARTSGFCSGSASSSSLGSAYGSSGTTFYGCPWSGNVKPVAAKTAAADFSPKSNPSFTGLPFGQPFSTSISTATATPNNKNNTGEQLGEISYSLDSSLKAIWKDAEEELVEARFRTLSLNSDVGAFCTSPTSSSVSSSFKTPSSSSLASSTNNNNFFTTANKVVDVSPKEKKNSGDFESATFINKAAAVAVAAKTTTAPIIKTKPKPVKEGEQEKRKEEDEEKMKKEEKEKVVVNKITSMANKGPHTRGSAGKIQLVQLVSSLSKRAAAAGCSGRTRTESETARALLGRDPTNPKSFASACVVLPPPTQAKQSTSGGNDGRGGGNGSGGNGNGTAQKRQFSSISAKKFAPVFGTVGIGGGGGGNAGNRTAGKPAPVVNFAAAAARGGGGNHRSQRSHGTRGKKGQDQKQQQCQSQQRSPPTKMECSFCRNISGPDGESGYKTHWLKDRQNVITCPKLRAYTCPLCLCPGGDKAHTKLLV